MEFENVSMEVQWECRRVAAAFGAQEMVRRGKTLSESSCTFQGRRLDGLLVVWTVDYATAQWSNIAVGTNHNDLYYLAWRPIPCLLGNPDFREHLSKGIYCLGFEDESLLAELDSPLSMHEKLELRLSMPREFWPKKWLDEEE